MEIKEFIQNFASQFDDTDVSEFTANTEFRELDEWSSLTALSVIWCYSKGGRNAWSKDHRRIV